MTLVFVFVFSRTFKRIEHFERMEEDFVEVNYEGETKDANNSGQAQSESFHQNIKEDEDDVVVVEEAIERTEETVAHNVSFCEEAEENNIHLQQSEVSEHRSGAWVLSPDFIEVSRAFLAGERLTEVLDQHNAKLVSDEVFTETFYDTQIYELAQHGLCLAQCKGHWILTRTAEAEPLQQYMEECHILEQLAASGIKTISENDLQSEQNTSLKEVAVTERTKKTYMLEDGFSIQVTSTDMGHQVSVFV